tara:strand:+ start:598 stop:1137 length:540 start_codon:yes stop_codon:yes gene_type:complete
MRTFDIYENPEGMQDAVKRGWSWPGFFFSIIWCFIKGLGGTGLTILLIAFIDACIYMTYPVRVNYYGQPVGYSAIYIIISSLLPFIISLWLGARGNNKRRNKLIITGYKLEATLQASNPESAITMVINKKVIDSDIINKKQSSNSELDQIEKLHSLKEKGIITDEEFEKKKKEILSLDS